MTRVCLSYRLSDSKSKCSATALLEIAWFWNFWNFWDKTGFLSSIGRSGCNIFVLRWLLTRQNCWGTFLFLWRFRFLVLEDQVARWLLSCLSHGLVWFHSAGTRTTKEYSSRCPEEHMRWFMVGASSRSIGSFTKMLFIRKRSILTRVCCLDWLSSGFPILPLRSITSLFPILAISEIRIRRMLSHWLTRCA
ncbi:hypothetical protein L207DRAFT_280202 [Hyaloscypha variabilis F]|uniref:Uncharacterized protein n=1 Tax=Hyaloscypha variabilis (strain UAMH 11265 / GT02V1 / F) TaxID=1149755 RepID=A0A2J6S0T5_HYAVF|nr:hypothetical protein L207DRAFT_280202 [Hyaloscypha variabilis F]